METQKKKLPIGIENFEEIRKEDFYYIDKTGLIVLLDQYQQQRRGEAVYPGISKRCDEEGD